MTTLRAARARGEVWDGRFFERDARFWPISQAARRFHDRSDWPAPEEYAAPGVRFATALKPRRQRRRGSLCLDDMYDAHIVRGVVPTRARCWHDYLNALVWATFPKSKRALHERQAALVRAWIPEGATRLPNARLREHDALAFIDEGGVIVAGDTRITFGHALYEGLVYGAKAMIARAIVVDASDDLSRCDDALAARLADRIAPEDLPRVDF